MSSDWRGRANKVIAEVVKENPGLEEREMRKKLSMAYPFRERRYHPYKIWCDAVNRLFAPVCNTQTVAVPDTEPRLDL